MTKRNQISYGHPKNYCSNPISLIFISAILIGLSSCSHKPYDLVMHNIGTTDAKNVEIIMGGKTFSFGWLTPDNGATQVRPSAPLNKEITIFWVREDGNKQFNSNLLLPQILPALKKQEWYEVVVSINDENEASVMVLVCTPPYGPCQ